MFEIEHLQVSRVYPPGMDKSGIPGKWFFSELVFKGWLTTSVQRTKLPGLYCK